MNTMRGLKPLLYLPIRAKLTIAFVALSLLPFLGIGLYSILMHTEAIQTVALEHLERDVLTIKERAATFLTTIESDIYFLRSFCRFDLLTHSTNRSVMSRYAREVEGQLLVFLRSKPLYYQIYCTDATGQAVVGVRRDDEGCFPLTEDELTRRGGQFYLHFADNVRPDEWTATPVELRGSHGRLIPALSYVLTLADPDGKLTGFLIVDVFAQRLFSIVETAHTNTGGSVIIANTEGFYLYHPEKKKGWNTLLATRDEENLRRDYPMAIADQILSGIPGTITDGLDDIVCYVPLIESTGSSSAYVLIEAVPKRVIFASAVFLKRFLWVLFVLFLGVSTILAYFAARHFTTPLAELTRGAQIIAGGQFGHRLTLRTNDEIERLAEQFNMMAQAIEGHEAQLQRQNERLEQMVQERTQEVLARKNALQAILDHVPSAFILLDPDLTVRSVSATFERITGRRLEHVVGKPCDGFLSGVNTSCAQCSARQVLVSGESIVTVRRLNDGADSERYIEQMVLPIREDDRVTGILEVLTDITERRRLEEQILRAEKLAATGEMAAVIAHGIRNSLTSVKMILQVQRRRKQLLPRDRESLEVALSSVDQMEGVVNHLLKFARPAPIRLTRSEVNRIVEESVAFALPQISQHGVEIITRLGERLPPVLLDHDRLKEVFVNLILNAAQAIPAQGRIAVTTQEERVTRTWYSSGVPGQASQSPYLRRNHDLLITKGTRVVNITVSDTGCGIPPEHLSRIFDPFFTTKMDGTGLGLSLARRTVEEHEGVIFVESHPGDGSRFTILLHAAPDEV